MSSCSLIIVGANRVLEFITYAPDMIETMEPLFMFYGTARKQSKFGLGWFLPIKLLISLLLIAGTKSSRISTTNFKEISVRSGQLPF
jgi:hypothetical protein